MMLFGIKRAAAHRSEYGLLLALVATVSDAVQSLAQQVKAMSEIQDAVANDIATIKAETSRIATNYIAAAAANQEKAIADAKAAWEADDEGKWQQAHADLSGVIAQMTAGQPITPPATASNPAPAAVAPPSAPATGAAGDTGAATAGTDTTGAAGAAGAGATGTTGTAGTTAAS